VIGEERLMGQLSMEIHSSLEVHFRDETRVSCFFESSATGSQRQFSEIFHFCVFAARQLSTFGDGTTLSALVGVMLRDMDGNPEQVRALAERGEGAGLLDFGVGSLQLEEYRAGQKRKRFEDRLDIVDRPDGGIRMNHRFKAKGFGLFGRGKTYPAQASIRAFLMYLGRRNLDDENYLVGLAQAAATLGLASMDGSVNQGNHLDVGWFCTVNGAGETNEWWQSLLG